MLYNDLKENIFILHENPEWIEPFAKAFARAGVSFSEILLTSGAIDLSVEPPKGVFWSRLSASSHTRDHAYSKEYGRAVLSWLKSYGRVVVNASNVLELEVSKVKQYLALSKHFKNSEFRVPKTIAAFSKDDLLELARDFKAPFITKHNQGGKGLGVKYFKNHAELESYANSNEWQEPIDGITLLQEYIASKEAFITRLEFVGGEFVYAVRVDTSDGGFELCPADACEVKPVIAGAACEVGAGSKFSLREDITKESKIVKSLREFLAGNEIKIAGIEFIEDKNNNIIVYDINTNTNYNSAVEEKLRANGKQGASDKVVEYLNSLKG